MQRDDVGTEQKLNGMGFLSCSCPRIADHSVSGERVVKGELAPFSSCESLLPPLAANPSE